VVFFVGLLIPYSLDYFFLLSMVFIIFSLFGFVGNLKFFLHFLKLLMFSFRV